MSHRGRLQLRFRHRLIVMIVAVTTATLGSALTLVAWVVNRSQEGQLDSALIADARQEVSEAAPHGAKQLQISDRPGPAPDGIGHLTKYAAIYGPDGNLFAATPTFRGSAPGKNSLPQAHETCFDMWFEHEHLRGVLLPVPGYPGATLLLAAPRFDLDRDALFLNRATLIIILFAVLWAGAVTTWVVNRFARGHEAIAAVARQVANGNLSARIDMHSSDHEMLQLAGDVNQMIDRLATLLSSQQEFVTHAAHELRSPLTTLYGELSHARRRARDAKEYEVAIDEALESARRLKVLTEDLLTLARVGASSDSPNELVAPRKIVEDAARSLAAEAMEREIAIRIEGECRGTLGRPLALERLFRNLLENAIRHSPRGGTVEIHLADQEDSIIVTLTDQGPGVSNLDRERIFEPFYRGPNESVDDLPGVGLGLAIVRKIAHFHGGDVTLGPKQERGAQFVVRLSAA